jgi:hypothetical protein
LSDVCISGENKKIFACKAEEINLALVGLHFWWILEQIFNVHYFHAHDGGNFLGRHLSSVFSGHVVCFELKYNIFIVLV